MAGNDEGEYAYHVFISDPRRLYAEGANGIEHACGEWLRTLFLDFFTSCLSDALPENARIFLDTQAIRGGVSWRAELERALSTSCCLVPIWSPPYFRSHYCLWEWYSFRQRGSGLVVPIGWTDSARFPEEARQIQIRDFSPYAFTNPGLLRTEQGVGLQKAVRELADDVARAVAVAPPYSATDQRFRVAELPPPVPKAKIPFMSLARSAAPATDARS